MFVRHRLSLCLAPGVVACFPGLTVKADLLSSWLTSVLLALLLPQDHNTLPQIPLKMKLFQFREPPL